MPHDGNKERQEISLVGRILSMETLLLLMGIASLVYGIVNRELINIFWAIIIIPGVFILKKVRKKDWQKHWQDLEDEQKARAERINRQKPPSDSTPEK